MPKPRRIAYRRASDTKWQVWWPILVTVAAYLVGGVGIYVGMSNQLAVQREQIVNLQRSADSVRTDLKERIDSLQRNLDGMSRYVVDLHNNEERRTR